MQDIAPDESTLIWLKLLVSGLLGWLLRGLFEQQHAIRTRINSKRAEKLIELRDPIKSAQKQGYILNRWIREWDGYFNQNPIPLYFLFEDDQKITYEVVQEGLITAKEKEMMDRVYDLFLDLSVYESKGELKIEDPQRTDLLLTNGIVNQIWHRAEKRLNRRLGVSKYRGLAALPAMVYSILLWFAGDLKRAFYDHVERYRYLKFQSSMNGQALLWRIWPIRENSSMMRHLDKMEESIQSPENPFKRLSRADNPEGNE